MCSFTPGMCEVMRVGMVRVCRAGGVLDVHEVRSRLIFSFARASKLINFAEIPFAADCHFSHPPSRPAPFSKPHGGAPPHGRYSATFNKPGKPTAAAGIGAWPAEQPTHVSDRLKRFAPKNDDGEQGERIIPGGGEGGETNKQGGGDDAKVEIVVEEESSPAATKVEEQ